MAQSARSGGSRVEGNSGRLRLNPAPEGGGPAPQQGNAGCRLGTAPCAPTRLSPRFLSVTFRLWGRAEREAGELWLLLRRSRRSGSATQSNSSVIYLSSLQYREEAEVTTEIG